MARTAVQFGAGNIGRGFMGQLFHESGLEVVFVDVVPDVLAAISERHGYKIHVVGPGAREAKITGIRAIHAQNAESVAEEIAHCEIACTAVGAANLPRIAPNIAAGLMRRRHIGGGPLNVLVCENLHEASDRLREYVGESVPSAVREQVMSAVGFVQAVVSRMVPLQTNPPNDPLSIRVEAFKRLPIDARAMLKPFPEILGVEPVDNFEAHVERKLYTHNCAHAAIGYLGWLRGIEFGWEALLNAEVKSSVDGVLRETGTALVRKHGFDESEQHAHVEDLLARFANRDLGDTCFRLARDPIRKLAPDDRLVGGARLCESQVVEPIDLARVIAAALRFSPQEDPLAQQLQRRIASEGMDEVLLDLCGISPDEPLGNRIRRERVNT